MGEATATFFETDRGHEDPLVETVSCLVTCGASEPQKMLKSCQVRSKQSQTLHLHAFGTSNKLRKVIQVYGMQYQWKVFLGFLQQGSAAAGGSLAVHSHHAALWEHWKPGWGPNPEVFQCFERFLASNNWLSEVVCVLCWIFLYFFWTSSCSCQRPLRHFQGCIETNDKGT